MSRRHRCSVGCGNMWTQFNELLNEDPVVRRLFEISRMSSRGSSAANHDREDAVCMGFSI